MKVVRLSAQRTYRLFPPRDILATHFCYRLSRPPPKDRSAAEKIKSKKSPNDTMGNRTRNLPACREVAQPTAPPRTARQSRGAQESPKSPLLSKLHKIFRGIRVNVRSLTIQKVLP